MQLSIKNKECISLLGGLCFFLSLVEYMIPKPIPFIRIGLANMPLILAIDILPFPGFVLLVLLKIIGNSLIGGTLFSYVFIFSLGATLISSLIMYVIRKVFGKKGISLIGISTAGAMVSNTVQLILAYFIVFGRSVYYMAMPVYLVGLISGIFLGCICEYFKNNSRWYAGRWDAVKGDAKIGMPPLYSSIEKNTQQSMQNKPPSLMNNFSSIELAIAGFIMLIAFLFNSDTATKILQALFFFLLVLLSGKKINYLMSLFSMSVIILFNLLNPYGEILFEIAAFKITLGALQSGLNRAFTLTGLLMLSRFSIRRDLSLPGFFGEIITESFKVFSEMEYIKLNRKNLLSGIDEALIRLDITMEGQGKSSSDIKNKTVLKKNIFHPRQLLLALPIIIAWILFFL